ncbi:MAG: OsmC family peroxiredoxin [Gammaproteobacteria bacterium]|nr:OsmC family peroxiredoxin [Gammaproteobacteria bacterium]
MSEYLAKIEWQRGDQVFTDNKYSRAHTWEFDGGLVVPASASPDIVPLPYSLEYNVDPEEAFVAAISSCHMLFFLSIAGQKGLLIDRYIDNAYGIMEKDESGISSISKVVLRPEVTGSALTISTEDLQAIHTKAHSLCFIANSVKSEISIEVAN